MVNGLSAFRDVAACRDPAGSSRGFIFSACPRKRSPRNRVHLYVHVDADQKRAEVNVLEQLAGSVGDIAGVSANVRARTDRQFAALDAATVQTLLAAAQGARTLAAQLRDACLLLGRPRSTNSPTETLEGQTPTRSARPGRWADHSVRRAVSREQMFDSSSCDGMMNP